jgi:uncharacterized protein (UPF0335 family)
MQLKMEMAMPRRKKTEDETPRTGHNGPSPVAFVERVERLHGQILKQRAECMVAYRALRADITDILVEAEQAGVTRRSLKAVLKARALEAKADAVRTDLEPEDRTKYDDIRVALGDFADLPLGQAALASASMSDRPFGAPPQ